MTEIKIEMSFDITDPKKNEALRQFLADFTDGTSLAPTERGAAVKALEEDAKAKEKAQAAKVEKEEALEKPVRKRRTKAEIEAEKAEEEEAEQVAPESGKEEASKEQAEEAPESIESPSVSLTHIRDLLSQKVKAHKAALKKKLGELGNATSVSVLEEQYFEEFYEFMHGLD